MKYYLVEPTYKKSLVEYTVFKREDEDGNKFWLRSEVGWRWGSFIFTVPETDEEIMTYIRETAGCDDEYEWMEDYGFMIDNGAGEDVPDPSMTLAEMLTQVLLPSEDEEFVDITEDYGDAEILEFWDGCWQYWQISQQFSHQEVLEGEEIDEMLEEIEEAYREEYEEGVEALGWEFVDTFFELQCNPKITPCDKNGKPLEDAA
jgi:hypothetical protein